jgi:hypothetical protein
MKFSILKSAGALLAAGFLCLTSDNAQAQAKQTAVSNQALIEASGQLTKKPAADDADEQTKKPMAWAGIGLKVGVGSINAASFKIKGVESGVPARMGVHAALPIHLGGDGASWLFEPYIMQSKIAQDVKSFAGNVVGSEDINLTALGMYMGPVFNIHATNKLYVGFGFGLKGAYIMQDAYDLALDAYARVPVHGTYYLNKTLALTAEVGFGYGASAFASKPDKITVNATPGASAQSVQEDVKNDLMDNLKFGTAMTWDATIGVRIP